MDEATSYEERRVIRGQIRHAKKTTTSTVTSSSTYANRFTTPTRRQTSPERRTPAASATKTTSRPFERPVATPRDVKPSVSTSRDSPVREADEKTTPRLHINVNRRPSKDHPLSHPTSPTTSRPSSPRKSSDPTSPAQAPSSRRASKGEPLIFWTKGDDILLMKYLVLEVTPPPPEGAVNGLYV